MNIHTPIKETCPFYLWIIFAVTFAFIAFLVANWVITRYLGLNHVEGFTYKPSTLAPNTTISFGYLDLVNDVSSICDFIKIDNQLVKIDPSNLSISSGDYTVPKTNLQIHNMYNALLGIDGMASTTLNDAMDASYAHLFDVAKIKTMRPQDISAQWLAVNPIQTDNALYNTVNMFVVQSDSQSRKCPTDNDMAGPSAYFLQSIIANKSNGGALDSLKYAFYAFIKPRFLANRLSNMYWSNVKNFTNSDKGTNDSVVYVLNTFYELIRDSTLIADLSANGAANIIGDATPFPTLESIQIYQLVSVVYEIAKFIIEFEKSGENAKIKTTAAIFQSGYPAYLEKVSHTATDSPFLFILKYPPDTNDCDSAKHLQSGLTSLKY